MSGSSRSTSADVARRSTRKGFYVWLTSSQNGGIRDSTIGHPRAEIWEATIAQKRILCLRCRCQSFRAFVHLRLRCEFPRRSSGSCCSMSGSRPSPRRRNSLRALFGCLTSTNTWTSSRRFTGSRQYPGRKERRSISRVHRRDPGIGTPLGGMLWEFQRSLDKPKLSRRSPRR